MCLSGKRAEARYSEGKVEEHMGKQPASPLNTSLKKIKKNRKLVTISAKFPPLGLTKHTNKPVYPFPNKSHHLTKVSSLEDIAPKLHDTNSYSKNLFLNQAALDISLLQLISSFQV